MSDQTVTSSRSLTPVKRSQLQNKPKPVRPVQNQPTSADSVKLSTESQQQLQKSENRPQLNALASTFGTTSTAPVPSPRPTPTPTKDTYPERMVYDGENLTIYNKEGQVIKQTRATSGQPGKTGNDTGKSNEGAIPEGTYKVEDFRVTPKDSTGDWGTERAKLTPINPDTGEVIDNGRTGIMMHGGIYPGSLGCVDLGDQVDEVSEIARQNPNLRLKVEYQDKFKGPDAQPLVTREEFDRTVDQKVRENADKVNTTGDYSHADREKVLNSQVTPTDTEAARLRDQVATDLKNENRRERTWSEYFREKWNGVWS